MPWHVLNEAGKSAYQHKLYEECNALWDEADAITNNYHERRLLVLMGLGISNKRRVLSPYLEWRALSDPYLDHNIKRRLATLSSQHYCYTSHVVVDGAGMPEINGRFLWQSQGVFERGAVHNGKKVVFTLFSRVHSLQDDLLDRDVETRFCWWHISIKPASSCKPGAARAETLYERPPPLWDRYQQWRTRTRTKIDNAERMKGRLSQKQNKKILRERRQIFGGKKYNPQQVSNTQPPAEGWVCSCDGVQPPPKVELVVTRPNGQPVTFQKMETLAETKQSVAQETETPQGFSVEH
jgi:hypothetical protein